jgi:hypothetical protein
MLGIYRKFSNSITRNIIKNDNFNQLKNIIELNQNEVSGNCIYEEQILLKNQHRIKELNNQKQLELKKWENELYKSEKIYVPFIKDTLVKENMLDSNITPVMYSLIDISYKYLVYHKNEGKPFLQYEFPSNIQSDFRYNEGMYYYYLNKGISHIHSIPLVSNHLNGFEMYTIHKINKIIPN